MIEQKPSPLITFIMCSRKKDNIDSHLLVCLDSIRKNLDDRFVKGIEVLIKFDVDDEVSYRHVLNLNWEKGGTVVQPNLLREYSFPIKEFVYARGEGRRSLQNDYMFLFSQRSPSSKFISFLTDDCEIVKKGLYEFLRDFIKKDWCIIGERKPIAIPDYRITQDWRTDVSMFPIVSVKLLEVLQNMGWQANIDNWFSLLHSILVTKYKIDIFYPMEKYIGRMGGKSSETQYPQMYNPFEVNNLKSVKNPYYFDLVEHQAKNVALNIYNDKLINTAKLITGNLM